MLYCCRWSVFTAAQNNFLSCQRGDINRIKGQSQMTGLFTSFYVSGRHFHLGRLPESFSTFPFMLVIKGRLITQLFHQTRTSRHRFSDVLVQLPFISDGAFKDGRSRPDQTSRTSDGGFELTCVDTDRTTRYMAVSRVSIVPRTQILAHRRPLQRKWRLDATDKRRGRQVDTHGGERQTGGLLSRGWTRSVSHLHGCSLVL